MSETSANIAPLYKKIKCHILDNIANGQWQPSERVPSENQLVKQFDVSRMTTNRALKELTSEGYLVRVAGVGTFVADLKAQSHPLEIHDIAEQVRGRGHDYSARVLSMEETVADSGLAKMMSIPEGTIVFHSVILHEEQGIALQMEDRYVNGEIVPDYGAQDFTKTTPYDYLMKIAPLQKVEHVVKAILPREDIRTYLSMAEDEACLLIKRRTWTKGQVASTAMLYHPGSRFELSGRFNP